MMDHKTNSKVSQDIGNTSSHGQLDNMVMEKSFDIKAQRVSWRCKNCYYACNDKAKTRRHIKAKHFPNYDKGEKLNEDPLPNEPPERLSKICKEAGHNSDQKSDNDNESEEILSKLNESLKNEISYLNETFPSYEPEENNETNEHFELTNEKKETCVVSKVEQINASEFIEFEETQNIKTEDDIGTHLVTRNEIYPKDDQGSDNILQYYVCPHDSCIFMTSTLTDLVITDHYADSHPDADPLEKIKFLPL